MAFDPNEDRDERGRWSTSGISSLISKDNVKALIVLGIQSAVGYVAAIDDNIRDAHIKHVVENLANDLKVTRATARNILIASINKLQEKRNKK